MTEASKANTSAAPAGKEFSAAAPRQKLAVKYTDDGRRELVLRNVRVSLPENGGDLLKNVNFTLKPGDRLVITGPSGCGKSSLVKAIAGLWDSGDGEISMPRDMSLLCISQKAYMPDTILPGILSYPLPADAFPAEKMESALLEAGLPQLVQYLPGIQLGKALDVFFSQTLPQALKQIEPGAVATGEGEEEQLIAGTELTEENADRLAAALKAALPAIVRSHIEISQGLPEAAKAGIAGQIARQVSAAFPGAAAEMLETVAAGVSAELENLLTLPLIEQLSQGMEEGAQKIVRRIGPLTADQAHGFGAALERAFHKGWGRHFSYKAKLMRRILNAAARRMPASIGEQIALPVPDMHNIYIPTAAQKKYLAAQLRARLEAALVAQSAGPKKSLSAVFNCVASPFTAWRLRRAGARAGGFILAGAVMQLNREHATGDSLSRRLSGGEQQRLGFARILLHKPEIVLLDEVTASLDPAAGSRLYSEIVAKLPDALIISVAHNMHVRAFHTLHARVEDKGLVIEKVLPEKTAKPGPAAPGPAQGA